MYVIAGITQNPTMLNPITYPEKNAERRQIVLKKMLEQGYISDAEYKEALNDNVYERIQQTNVRFPMKKTILILTMSAPDPSGHGRASDRKRLFL